jgi:hypothetical protein
MTMRVLCYSGRSHVRKPLGLTLRRFDGHLGVRSQRLGFTRDYEVSLRTLRRRPVHSIWIGDKCGNHLACHFDHGGDG